MSAAWSVTRSPVSDGRVMNESNAAVTSIIYFYLHSMYINDLCIIHSPDDSVLYRRQHHAPLPWTRPSRPHMPPIPAASSCQSPCRGITAPTPIYMLQVLYGITVMQKYHNMLNTPCNRRRNRAAATNARKSGRNLHLQCNGCPETMVPCVFALYRPIVAGCILPN